jgi:hypothetical protein
MRARAGVAIPSRADEFVPEGRLLVGRPFTTCATLVAVLVSGSPSPRTGMACGGNAFVAEA